MMFKAAPHLQRGSGSAAHPQGPRHHSTATAAGIPTTECSAGATGLAAHDGMDWWSSNVIKPYQSIGSYQGPGNDFSGFPWDGDHSLYTHFIPCLSFFSRAHTAELFDGILFFLIGLKSYPILARPSRSQWEHFEVSRMWPWDSKGVADWASLTIKLIWFWNFSLKTTQLSHALSTLKKSEPLKIPWLIDCHWGLYYLAYWGFW